MFIFFYSCFYCGFKVIYLSSIFSFGTSSSFTIILDLLSSNLFSYLDSLITLDSSNFYGLKKSLPTDAIIFFKSLFSIILLGISYLIVLSFISSTSTDSSSSSLIISGSFSSSLTYFSTLSSFKSAKLHSFVWGRSLNTCSKERYPKASLNIHCVYHHF